MKKIFLLLAAIGVFTVACGPADEFAEENPGNQTEQPSGSGSITISPATITVEATAQEYSVEVDSSCSWRATTEEDWITIKKKAGQSGKTTLLFSAKNYVEAVERQGKITIYNDDEELSSELTIIQKAFEPMLEVEEVSTFEFDYKGGEQVITVTTNFDYDVVVPEWITYEKVENGVKILVPRYVYAETRTDEVKIYSEKYQLEGGTITVSQTPPSCPVGTILTKNDVTGVVFYFDETLIKIVSVTEGASLQWSTEDATAGATSVDNGADNMSKIVSIDGWETKYPAFKWCADYGTDWYLPARSELNELYNHESVINTVLEENDFTPLASSWYWSSTEDGDNYAYTLNFEDGYPCNESKSIESDVRAVFAFQIEN